MKGQIKAVVFDLDGTMVDTQLDFLEMKKQIGIPEDQDILGYLDSISDENFILKAHKIIDEHESKGALNAKPIADVENFLNFLNEKNIPTAILTRNSKKVTELVLKNLNWKLKPVITRDCAAFKPNPEGLNIIANELKLDPRALLFIGDHLTDLETAKNANSYSALIENDNNTHFAPMANIRFKRFQELFSYF